jgi:iron(III) transport system ATP-binding protein
MALYVDIEKKLGSFHLRAKFEVDGETLALLGASGCGKSMTLKCIAGIERPDRGQIILDGETLFDSEKHIDLPPQKRRVGYLFQQYALFPSMTAEQNILCCIRSGTRAEKKRQLAEAIRLFRLEGLERKLPAQLSGGQQQRVALARAIVIEPDILLMDEPLCNLDAKLRVTMRTSIKKLQRKLGITTIYVTHDQEEALSISDRIAVMRAGKVMQIGGPREIYDNPANMFVANFIGTSCFLDGTAKNGKVRILDAADVNARVDPAFADKVKVSVRPEHFIIESKPTDGAIRGTITLATFLGDFICYEIQLSNGQIIEANEYTDRMRIVRSVGDEVGLRFVEERINVFDAETEESIMQ